VSESVEKSFPQGVENNVENSKKSLLCLTFSVNLCVWKSVENQNILCVFLKTHIHIFFRRKYFSTEFLFFNTPFFQAFHFFSPREKVYVKSAHASTGIQTEIYRGKMYVFRQKLRRRLDFFVFHNFDIYYGIYCYDLFKFYLFFFF